MQSGERIAINGRDYRLGAVLSTGVGSYGQVWAASDAAGRPVALKFINTEAMSQADPALRSHWRAHLEREIAFLGCLNAEQSRHVVILFDHGSVEDQPVLVMERLQANLGQWLTRRRGERAAPPDLERILDWAGQILEGLEVIHDAGFVYRDLKFSNILVGEDGALLKLADFGSLKREDGDDTRSFVGTPAAMAPEQVLPVRQGVNGCEYAVDCRADFYALGLLLFTLLTERSTTEAQRRLGQLLALHGQEGAGQHREALGGLLEDERELLRRSIEFWTVPVLPEQAHGGAAALLSDLIGRLLARDPADRPADSREIRVALEAARAGSASARPPVRDPLPAGPPHRRPRRADVSAHHLSWIRRGVGLVGVLGLAGAMAWAFVIRPGAELQREPIRTPDAIIALATPTATTAASAPTTTPAVTAAPAAPEPPRSDSAVPIAAIAESAARSGAESAVGAPAIAAPPKPVESAAPAEPAVAATPPEPTVSATAARPAPARLPALGKVRQSGTPPPATVATRRPPVVPPPTSPGARSDPKSLAPTASAVTQAPPPPARIAPARTAPRGGIATAPVARVTRPVDAAPPRPEPTPSVAASTRPVAHAQPRQPAPPALPPIELTAHPRPAPPALPPIELTARPRSTSPAAPPPIKLVSRASPTPPPQAASAPSRDSDSAAPSRAADSVTGFQENANRAAADIRRQAEAFTRWASRATAAAGSEVQRGLESASQAVNPWAGNGNAPVERRDRWSSHHDNRLESPPRQPREYR